jgi:UDP-N-acetylmuramate: L-alanyl-gamma-D-glutamyl-meso-diaminopimelate ligase
VIARLRAVGRTAESLASADAIAEYLGEELREGDVMLVLSNGSFDGLCDKLLARLAAKSAALREVR